MIKSDSKPFITAQDSREVIEALDKVAIIRSQEIGIAVNRSDVIRTAVREYIKKYGVEVPDIILSSELKNAA